MERPLSSIPEPDPRERALARTLGIPDVLARVLLARGLDDPELAKEHLRPSLARLADPFLFVGMERAVRRIRKAVRNQEPILIHGDYDVDGVTGTVLLVKLFSLMQANARPFIPAREDGYSITEASLEAVRQGGYKLLISVDSGTNAIDYVEKIQALGCDVIVTDHHGTSEDVACAHTILNPRLKGAGYPDRDLAGVGVAFRLAAAIAQSFSKGKTMSKEFESFLIEAMAYVALGTVADVAPLRGENRILVHHGLQALAVSRNPGIRALMDSAGLGDRSPDAEDISFRLAPLINAAGRMGTALEAVQLLMAPGYQEAQMAASALETHNDSRRKIERSVIQEVMAEARSLEEDLVIVLGGEGWHRGVLGIVAARVAEKLDKPTILLSFENGLGRGSGRSARGFNLQAALSHCNSCLLSYGGHHAAVGLEIKEERLEELRARINGIAGGTPRRRCEIQVDGAAEFSEFGPREVRRLDSLGPFGAGNPRPVFVTGGLKLVGRPVLDLRGLDLKFRVAKNGVLMPVKLHRGAALFEEVRNLQGHLSLCYSPRMSSWSEEGPVYLQAWHVESCL